MKDPYDTLLSNIAEMIREEVDTNNTHQRARLVKLAEAIYLEIVADYQQEPCAYGQDEEDEEEDDLEAIFPVGCSVQRHINETSSLTGVVVSIDKEKEASPILVRWRYISGHHTDFPPRQFQWVKPEDIFVKSGGGIF